VRGLRCVVKRVPKVGIIQLEVNALPHPGPLPKERENDLQPVMDGTSWCLFAARQVAIPSPGGEGQGEGEPHTQLDKSE